MRRTKYLPATVNPKQEAFLSLTCREALFGGAAGGSKTWALCMAGLQYVDIPGYSALILRKHSVDLYKSKGIVDTLQDWLMGTDAVWNGGKRRWTFPTTGAPAILELGHFDSQSKDSGVFGISGTGYQYIGVDELTEFAENEYKFLFRSLRKPEGMDVPLRMRGGTNPLGFGAVWVKKRFITDGKAHGRVFMPSKIDDNLHMNREEYVKSLMELDPYTREQLLEGNWDAKPPGKMFRREWFNGKYVRRVPHEAIRVRFWDLAATPEDEKHKSPSWTCGIRMAYEAGLFYVEDVVRERETPGTVKEIVKAAAHRDGPEVEIHIEQEGGNSGKFQIDDYVRFLPRFVVKGMRPLGPKESRAAPFASQCEAGNVRLIEALWNEAYLEELEQFPSSRVKNDQVDASSGAYNILAEEVENDDNLGSGDLYAGGDLPTPDW